MIDAVQLEFHYVDLVPPTVAVTGPVAGAVDVAVTTAVTAAFDEAIDPATLTELSFTLAPAGGDPVPATVMLDAASTTATLAPQAALAHGTVYEARLAGAIADGDGNHLAADHVWTFTTLPPDLTAPVVVAAAPAAGTGGVLPGRSLSVDFDEAIDPATLTAASFTVAPRDGVVVAADLSYDPETRRATLDPVAELDLATTYEVRLTTAVADLAGNPLAADLEWSFTTRFDPVVTTTATTDADFAAGTLTGAVVAEADTAAASGQLRLAPLLSDRFDQATLDPQWVTTRPAGYVPVIEDGLLDVQERDDSEYLLSAIESVAEFGPSVVLEARAMFVPGSAFIDVGLDANTNSNSQYAWFSTAGTGGTGGDQKIFARVREFDHTTTAIETSARFNQWHVFKIVWTAGRTDFYVDGVLEATFTDVLISMPMHAAFYKSAESSTPFYIDWIRVTPYAETTGEYVSPVADGGLEPAAWLDLQWSGTTPPGTSVVFATRTGDTPAPDASWSEWSDTSGDDVTSPPARYAQYRATLATTDPLASPVIEAVHLTHGPPGDTTAPQVIATTPAAGAENVVVDVAVLATFSEAIAPLSLTAESFVLLDESGAEVPAVVSYHADQFTAMLLPEAALASQSVYEVRLDASVTDAAGNALADAVGWTFTTEAIGVAAPDLPVVTALQPNFPNPFNPATTVRFDLARQQRVGVRLYGVDGRLVRTLVAGELPAGRHERLWNGRDEAGREVATGVYLLQMVTEEATETRKISLLK